MAPALMHSLPEIGSLRLREVDAKSMSSKPKVQAQHANSAYELQYLGDVSTGTSATFVPTADTTRKVFSCKVRRAVDITPSKILIFIDLRFDLIPRI
jgi:hypothetical protein